MTASSGLGVVRPYPLQNLVDAAGCRSAGELGRRLGISGTTLQQAVNLGLSDVQADHWSVRAGLHPESVWPGWTDAGLSVLDSTFPLTSWWRHAWEWAERFWSKVEKTDGCWLWTGSTNKDGYGSYCVGGGRTQLAHRVSVLLTQGSLTEGLEIDHLCGVRACVRPDHLEEVDRRTNVLRSNNPAAVNARKDACPEGHPYDAQDADGRRRCSACRRERDRARKRRNRASRAA